MEKEKTRLIIRPRQLAEMLQVSSGTIWRMEKDRELPPRRKISRRAVGWLKKDIDAWLDDRPASFMEPEK